MKFHLLMLTLCVLFFYESFGKEEKVKFGKIDKSHLEMKIYDKDSSAVALVLYENGTSKIEYQQNIGWRLVFNKHQRIKILKKEGVKYADFQIGLSKSNNESEDLGSLKAITFNLEGGKIVKSELSKKDVHLEEVNSGNELKSFTLPNVKVGSVIDIRYNIDCKMFFRNMRPWKFQHDIPTLYSEYHVRIPEYFNFRKFVLGFEQFSVQEEDINPVTINLSGISRSTENSNVTRSTHNNEQVKYINKNYHWIAEDMPSFVKEAYVSSADNYVQQVQFELQSIKFPHERLYTYSRSWESINNNLKEDDDFGKVVFGSIKILEEKVHKLIKETASDEEKVAQLLNYVQSNYKFDGNYSIYSKGLKKVEKDMNGNVADINLYLTALLRTAGFEAKPVVLSTRANGAFVYPTVTGFNYVVVQCKLNDKNILLDGTNKYCCVNEIPFFCLNGSGLVVGGSQPEWIELLEIGTSELRYAAEINIGSEGQLSGQLKILRKGYSANRFRNKVGKYNSIDEYLKAFEEDMPDWEIEKHSLENFNSLEKHVSESIHLKINNKCIYAGDRIYLSPIIFNPETENPFKLKERKYPVDFGYKIRNMEMSVLNIPEGYVIEEIPESINMALPERKVFFSYGINKLSETKIQVISSIVFKQSIYLAEDYQNLKALINQMIEKHKQQIILKKI